MRVDMSSAVKFSLNDGLSFSCIDSIAIKISSPNNPSLSLPPSISSGNKNNIIGGSSNRCESNVDKSWDEASDPLISLQFNEFFNPISIVKILESFVFEGIAIIDELLEGAGEIILIWEVPKFIAEKRVHTIDIYFIFRWFLIVETEIFHFLDLEDLPSKDLSNQRCLRDHN